MAAVSQLEHWDWIRWTGIVAWEATTLIEDACTCTGSLTAKKKNLYIYAQHIYIYAHT